VLLTFTPARELYSNRYGNAVIVAILTTLGDLYSHASQYRHPFVEHLLTGVTSGVLTLLASYLFENNALRIRMAWASLRKYIT